MTAGTPMPPALQRRVASGELTSRAAVVELHCGDGSSADPAAWARLTAGGHISQPDDTDFEPSPWPRPRRLTWRYFLQEIIGARNRGPSSCNLTSASCRRVVPARNPASA